MPSRVERLRRYWNRQADSYDRKMALADRKFFGDTREWICSRARGEVLEVAVGTGLNLGLYPRDVRLVGVDFSQGMLDLARHRAESLDRDVELRLGDAQRLEFPDESFDTVVATFSLCAIPDDRRAVAEMARLLRPGGLLLLADHVASSSAAIRILQGLIEVVTIPLGGENFRRRPLHHVLAEGFDIQQRERFKAGIVERLVASKPPA